MIKKYSWTNSEFSMRVEIAVDTKVFTKEMAMEHINFFSNKFNSKTEPEIDYAAKSHAEQCLLLAICDQVNIHGVIDSMGNTEGYFPVDGSKGIQLIDIEGLTLDLDDSFNFHFEESELDEMPDLPEMSW